MVDDNTVRIDFHDTAERQTIDVRVERADPVR